MSRVRAAILDAPLSNAAGTAKTVDQARELVAAHVPRVMMGSYTREARPGNEGTTYYESPVAALNSLGLPSPDVSTWSGWVSEVVQIARGTGSEVWVSVAGFSTDEFAPLVVAALEAGADAVEVNLGCPNIWEGSHQKRIFSYSAPLVEDVLGAVSSVAPMDRVGVKLSPIFDTELMSEVDDVLLRHDVAFATTMNTLPNCMALGSEGVPVITPGGGLAGMSGPAIKWVALGQVAMHRSLMPTVPIIGVGGVTQGQDVHDMLTAGADSCQVATSVWKRGPRAFHEILAGYVDQ